jgi:hypothetical protein
MIFAKSGNSQVQLANARANYNDLTANIREYMRFIMLIEKRELKVSTAQYQMIRSSMFLILYNLIESTMALLIKAVSDEINNHFIRAEVKKILLQDKIANEVIKSIRSDNVTGQSFFDYSVGFCDRPDFKISAGGGGNWNYINIFDFSKKIGINLDMYSCSNVAYKKTVVSRAKFVLDAKDAKYGSKTINAITDYRNKLAHGEISFHELSVGLTAREIKTMALKTKMFLFHLIKAYEIFIFEKEYLKQEVVQQ